MYRLYRIMDNFEETVVNPNICLKDIDGQLQRVSRKQEHKEPLSEEESSCKKSVNGYFLFAATAIVILLIAIATRS